MIPTKIVCLVPIIVANGECIFQSLMPSEAEAFTRVAHLSENKADGGTRQFKLSVAHLYEELAENRQDLKNLHEPSPFWPFPDLNCLKP